jgi:hypothetical protein
MTRTVVGNADALHALVEQGRKIETREGVGAELERVSEVLARIGTLGGDCHASAPR